MKKMFLSLVLCFTMMFCTIPIGTFTVSAAYENTYTNTGNQRIDIIGVAKTQIGNTNGLKYRSDGANWCAAFVVWCARQAGIDSSIIKDTGWATADDLGVTYKGRDASRSVGINYTPSAGDLIIFDWESNGFCYKSPASNYGDHVGIVEYVENGYVHTIEGNSNNSVRRNSYSLSSVSIKGYGVPSYKTPTPTTSVITIDNYNYPKSFVAGVPYSVKGLITSNYDLTYVHAAIRDKNSNTLQSVSKYPNTKTFDIATVKDSLEFDSLPIGTYYYHIEATDSSGNFKNLLNVEFSVISSIGNSQLSLHDYDCPTEHPKGMGFDIAGIVSSNYAILRVYVAIRDTSGKMIQDAAVYPNSYEFSLSNFNEMLDFSKLNNGEYYYYAEASDGSGKFLSLFNKKFTVAEYPSTLAISNMSYPFEVCVNIPYIIKGTISSNYDLTYVHAAIRDENSNTLQSVSRYPDKKTFDMASIRDYLKFESLAVGTYYYHVEAIDSSGKFKNLLHVKFTIVNTHGNSSLQLTGHQFPSEIIYDTDLNLNGTVVSNYCLIRVYAAIIDSSGKILYDAACYSNTFEFNVSEFNDEFNFGILPIGEYVFHIEASDGSGNFKNLTNDKFSVVKTHIHKYTEQVVLPTCSAMGYTTHTCSCGETYTEILSALGHDYQNGVCTRCHEVDPEYAPPVIGTQKGDVDGDSSVTVSDLTLVAKSLAGWQVTMDQTAADVDGDKAVTVSDLTLLAKYLAGWQVTLG